MTLMLELNRRIEVEATHAQLAGCFGTDGTRVGTADGRRSIAPSPRARRRCCCGCTGRATHVGLGDGLAMMSGCELTVRRWVRDGYSEAGTHATIDLQLLDRTAVRKLRGSR